MTPEERQQASSAAASEAKVQKEPEVKWDDSKMQTAYANAMNVTSTREEVPLFIGTNQTWNVGDDNKVQV